MTVILLTLFTSLAVAPELKYPKNNLNLSEGSAIELKCVTEYQPRNCTELSVFWCKTEADDSSDLKTGCEPAGSQLDRQLIIMNETHSSEDETVRLRDVILKLTNITKADTGSYQCQASCSSGGAETAVGHIVTLKTHGNLRNLFLIPIMGISNYAQVKAHLSLDYT